MKQVQDMPTIQTLPCKIYYKSTTSNKDKIHIFDDLHELSRELTATVSGDSAVKLACL